MALLGTAGTLTSRLASAYGSVQQQWTQTAQDLNAKVSQLNTDASQVAQLNEQIRSAAAAGTDTSALVTQRSTLLSGLATLSGATVTANADQTVTVRIGGANLVQGSIARSLTVTGSTTLEGAAGSPAGIQWSDGAGVAALGSGQLAGELSLLAPATAAGNGGPIAETAARLNTLATDLATSVNAVSVTGATATGATGVAFFGVAAGAPAATGLSVLPTDVSGVAVGALGAGAADGSIADAIGRIGASAGSPDATWSAGVVALGALTQAAAQQSSIDQAGQAAAANAQSAQESVSLDEENMHLVAYQHAYEGAARVMTALDSILDQLINHTGLVGLG
jgi:flagellar hook-associated protein 1 FlgK